MICKGKILEIIGVTDTVAQVVLQSKKDDTYYIICSKENFKECTFFATVKNVPYNETISRDEFYKIKEFIKKK